MAPIFGARRTLSHGDVRFITRDAAMRLAIVASAVAAVIALALGVAIGAHWSASTQPARSRVEHDYTIDQLGKLDADFAQIEPRIERLSAQVDALSDFQARLGTQPASKRAARPGAASFAMPAMPAAQKTPLYRAPRVPEASDASPASAAPASDLDSDTDGEGGPLLPPRPCPVGRWPTAHASIPTAQRTLGCIAAALSLLEQQTASDALAYTAFPGRMPVDGARFGSPFGNRIDPFTGRVSFHPGLDLVAPTGTTILASAGGRVTFAGEKSGYGNAVEIDHGNGLATRYGHASRLLVKAGDLVLPRQPIAEVGSTGRSTGPHLHFEVLIDGAPVDPITYLALFGATPHG